MRLILLASLLLLPGCVSRQPLAYRDLQVYAESIDSEGLLTIRNRSGRALFLEGQLGGKRWQEAVPQGEVAEWRFQASEELRGEIRVDGELARKLVIGVDEGQISGVFAPRPTPRARRKAKASVLLHGFRILDTVPVGAGPGTREELSDAVRDLQRIVHHVTGETLPLVADSAKPLLQVRLSMDERLRAPGSYRLKIAQGDIRIESASLEGARNGIYGFLTDYLGCRWYQPRGLGEVLPEPVAELRLPVVDEWQQPSWFSAPGMSWRGCGQWDRRNRSVVNDGRMKFGHAWGWIINFDSHPPEEFGELYAKDENGEILVHEKGWSRTNFCDTHPRVLEIVADAVNASFDAEPERIVASLDPNDYAPMCSCTRCLATGPVSDRLLRFSQEIRSRLKPEHKEKYLGVLIYGHQMELPKRIKPDSRHAGVICNFPPRYDHSRPWSDPSSEVNRDFLRLVRGWGERLSQLGYYDYYGHYYYFGPYPMLYKMREDLPTFHEMGGTFLDIEAQPNFGIQGLNHYIAARLVWDVHADVDALLDDFLHGYYQEAAEEMRAFWMRAERHFALTASGVRTETRAATPAFWRELDALLLAAERRAESPAVQDRLAFHRAGFDYGRRRFALQLKYGRSLKEATSDEAKDECREYARWVRELRNRFPDGGDSYWPPLVREVFYLDVDALLKR